MDDKDVFTAMIEEELNQYKRYFLFQERKLMKRGDYNELATKSLRQTRIIAVIVMLNIIAFSLLSIYHFIQFGNFGEWASLFLGIASWAFVIISTIFYSTNIVHKKRCMERVLKLLEAREQFYNR